MNVMPQFLKKHSGLALCSALISPILSAGTPALDKAVVAFAEDSDSAYRYAFTDLNNDGRSDAIVLMRSSDWCGTGGCTMVVFQGTPEGFKFISRSTVTREPIYVLREANQGWRTLVVSIRIYDEGPAAKKMRFDGKEYPLNPSMQPAAVAKDMGGAKLLKLEE